jgi:hypothetical protein
MARGLVCISCFTINLITATLDTDISILAHINGYA